MRQISIKELNKHLSQELNNLPFEVIKYGKVIGVMAEKGTDLALKGTDNKPEQVKKCVHSVKGTDNPIKRLEKQLVEVIEKKQSTDNLEAQVSTGGRRFYPQPKLKDKKRASV